MAIFDDLRTSRPERAIGPPPSIVEVLFGLVLTPRDTVETLLEYDPPPYRSTCILFFYLTIFIPMIIQYMKYDETVIVPLTIALLFFALTLSLATFIITEAIMLLLLRTEISPGTVVASIAYSLTPVTIAIWIVYIFNYMTNGNLSIVTFILTGMGTLDSGFIRVIPWATLIIALIMFVVLFYCLRFLGSMIWLNALGLTTLSLLPLLFGVAVGLSFAEALSPGSYDALKTLLFDFHLASP